MCQKDEISLSVIMSSYNYGHFLPIALEAVLNQSFQPLEIIIIDDGSTDDSIKIIQEYQKKFSLIQFHQNSHNLGVIETANKGIDLAKGDYIVFCAADDEILPNFFEKSMNLLKKYPQAAICSSIFCIFYSDQPTKTSCYSGLLANHETYLNPKEFAKRIRKKDCRLGGQNTIFKKEAFIKAGKLLPELGPMCDWFLIFVLGFRYGVCFIPKPLTTMRIHPKAYSQQSNPSFSKRLLNSVDEILSRQEFQDIYELFRKSGVIYQIGLGMVFSLLLRRRNWKFIHFFLIFQLGLISLKSIKQKLIRLLKNL